MARFAKNVGGRNRNCGGVRNNMAAANKYINPTEVKQALDDLHQIATEQKFSIFENIHESNIRKRFEVISGITPELIDASILALLRAREVRNNKMITMPTLTRDGILSCFLCNQTPVVVPTLLIPNQDPDPHTDHEDLSFLTFICAEHADNRAATQKEIDNRHMLWYLQREYKAMKKEDSYFATDLGTLKKRTGRSSEITIYLSLPAYR
jgi:hypothetical protein